LALWTGLDPPQKASEYTLTEETTDKDDYIVALSHYCEDGNSDGWKFAAVGWNGVLLLCASVLAFQSRDIIQTFNESQTLAMLIYSHFVFVVLRCATYFLEHQLDGTMLNHIRSLLYSVDTLATIVIYFVPKLLAKAKLRPSVSTRISGLNSEALKVPGMSGLTNSNPQSDPMGKSGSITNSGPIESRQAKEPEHALHDEALEKADREIPAF
jgi:7 transmembrane sweet-taste receptor of 3 GCPR